MKKAVCVMLVLLLALLPLAAFAADSYVCFIALNESLLPLSSQAYSQGGQYYVPIGVFSEFHLYNDYHATSNTARLYSSSTQMFFNVATGETYDANYNYYTSSAIMRGGTVYVPVDFFCRQFGLSWSYIRGSGYGDVCRITNGSAALTDEQFLIAAGPLMASRYAEYTGSVLSPSVDSGDTEDAESVIFLSFQGLPSMEILDTLETYSIKAAFFVTADDILESPETIRRIVGQGHNIGALCSAAPASDFTEVSDLLWEAASVSTVMLASSSREYDAACDTYASSAGLVFCDYTIGGSMSSASVSEALSGSRSPIMYLRLQCGRTTESSLNSIITTLINGSVILAACETSEP